MAPPTYDYPFATSPDIIRSHQKDAYFQATLLNQLSAILRRLYGARFAHTHTSEARVFSELLYLGLTTGVGNRTLGEEYCDVVQVKVEEEQGHGNANAQSSNGMRLPSTGRRASYIVLTILVPYGLGRILPRIRRSIRAFLETRLRLSIPTPTIKPTPSQAPPPPRLNLEPIYAYALAHVDALTSPAPITALSLATFYFTGSYYHLSKRLLSLRYVFTRQLSAAEQQSGGRVGYEVLGFLLACQMAVQAWLHVRETAAGVVRGAGPDAAAHAPGRTAVSDGEVEVSLDPNAYASNNALLFESPLPASTTDSPGKIAEMTHTPVLPAETYRVHLADKGRLGWMVGRQVRKCTLCLEELKEPSATTCGHVFCWGCIGDWLRENAQCPLCRQGCAVQHVLPLRG